MNGSAILDDMQMAYMDLETMQNLNSINKSNVSPKYANVKTDGEDKFESLITKWHDLDLEIYKKKLEQLKEERSKELEELNKKYEEEKEKLEKEEEEKADLLGTNKTETVQTTKASRTKPQEESDNSSTDNSHSNVSSDDTYEGDSDLENETEEDKEKEIYTKLEQKHQSPNMSLVWDKDLDEIKEEDYLFKMDWTPMDLNLQEPDIKPYPNEHIKSKYKIQGGDAGEEENGTIKPESEEKDKEENNNENNNSAKLLSYARDKKPEEEVVPEDENKNPGLNPDGDGTTPESENEEVETDPEDHKPWNPDMDFESDLKWDKETNEKLKAGEWVDTREVADTTELNKYTSEDFYYEGFNINRGGNSGMGGAQCRAKITEMALKIVGDHKNGKACYTQSARTNDYDKPVIGSGNGLSGVPGYDCSSFVSCCYRYAGLTEVCDKNSDGINSCCSKGYRERLTMDNLDIAQAGDIIWRKGHVMIYIGNGEIAHASTGKKPVPDGIKVSKIDRQLNNNECYVERPSDLIAADQMASSAVGSGSGEACSSVVTKNGIVSCVWKFTGAVCTNYSDNGHCSDGTTTSGGNVVAAHNFRFGSQIYIPALDGKGGGGIAGDMNLGPKNNGMFRVADNGGPYFDFDVHSASGTISKGNYDVYVISFGKGPLSWSFSEAIRDAKKRGNFHPEAWQSLISKSPQTLRFTAFKQEDLNLNINDPLGSV